MISRQATKDAYKNGRIARLEGDFKKNCPFGEAELCLKHWWLAGWNDKDMELNNEH
jgi:ribosome modulation factor